MVGILQSAPTIAGESVDIMVDGISKAVFNVSMSAGANFMVGASGKIHSTGAAATGNIIYGPVIDGVSSSGEIGSVLLKTVGIAA